jgi:hypothetical protein
MKDYTLAEEQVSQEAKDFLDYLSKGSSHFKVHAGQLYWQMEGNLGMTTWTKRQMDIHRVVVKWDHLMPEAFKLNQAAIKDQNWDAVAFTCEQLYTTAYKVFTEAIEKLQEMTIGSTKSRQAGKKGRGVKRESGHDWDAICHSYDKFISEGLPRAEVTQCLSGMYNMRKGDLNRGLRLRERGSNRGRGRSTRKHP